MINFNETHKRLIIPKWFSLARTMHGRELIVPRTRPFEMNTTTRRKLTDDYAEFKQGPSPLKASDLMGAAFVVGERKVATEAAQYVMKTNGLQKPTINLAEHILNSRTTVFSGESVQLQIALLKITLSNFPKNPLAWIDLARLYTIEGQIDKARRAVTAALVLAPCNRFVVRSAVRFYMHIDEADAAWYYIRKALTLGADPWIEAMHINVAMVLEKNPRKLIRERTIDVSSDKLYQYSELIETRGMLELESGNDRRARKNFRLAWMDPSENVVTHGEWVLRTHLSGMAKPATLNMTNNPEAEAWMYYWRLDLKQAMTAVRAWGLEEPYSRHPWTLGSSILCHIENYKEAESLAKQGLFANPKDFLLNNNLTFALLKEGKVKEAEDVLKFTSEPKTETERPVNLATRGLLEFKKGMIERGRDLYLQAVEEFKKIDNTRLLTIAYLNLAIAEVEAGEERVTEFVTHAMVAAIKCTDPEIILTLKQLRNSFDKKQKSRSVFQQGEFVRLSRELEVLIGASEKKQGEIARK